MFYAVFLFSKIAALKVAATVFVVLVADLWADYARFLVCFLLSFLTRLEGEVVDGFWWRQLLSNDAPVSLLIKGQVLTGRASVVLDDPEYTRAIFRRLRPKVPEWLPDWLNGKLVVIHLDASVELSR